MSDQDLIEIIKREIEKYYSKESNLKEILKKKIGFIGNDIVLKDELKRNFDIQETGEKIVVSELGIKELAEISQGVYSSEESKKLLYNLLEGKELIVVEEGIEWRKFISAPFKLQERYRNYEKVLESYGTKIMKRIEIREYLEERKNCFTEKLLDLKALKKNINSNGTIEISNETKVTELAKEYAGANNIKIVKR